ncbi:hypothetical protein ABZX77_40645 [Streptomyces sp. NPDC004237]|uniref:hypothetical protein n=1 Tax=Streptomyces sp. NPDC004237 TaxID=3154455 RepID=UPI0033A2AF15
MNNCPPGYFCPAHPEAPGYLFLTAVAILALLLFVTAAVALALAVHAAARCLARAYTRLRSARAIAGTRPRAKHRPYPPVDMAGPTGRKERS